MEDADTSDIYDSYELFYNDVFGRPVTDTSILPYDYKASIEVVLKSIDEEQAYIIKRHFCMFEYENEPFVTLAEVGKSIGKSGEKVKSLEAKGLRSCRSKECQNILKYGIEKYTLMEENAKAIHEKQLEMKRQHKETVMAKFKDTYNGDVIKDIIAEIKEVSIYDLSDLFSVRAFNVLLRNFQVKTLYDVIILDVMNKDDLMDVPGIGKTTANNIIGGLDGYLVQKYGIKTEKLREAYGYTKRWVK